MNLWNIEENSKFQKSETPLVERETMLVQTLDEEDSNKYFIPPKNLECNEGGRLGINKEIKIHI